MLAKLKSCVLSGLDSKVTQVEVDISSGLPALNIVGLPDASVREAKERIRSAINNSGYKFPVRRITINLAPADMKKEGSHFDLSMAIGIIVASKQLENVDFESWAMIGELSLDGKLNRVKGVLPHIIGLREAGITKIVLPEENAEEASIIEDVQIYEFKHLREVVDFFNGQYEKNIYCKDDHAKENPVVNSVGYEDFSDIAGQENVKRAFQIAASGSHNILMIGPPGSGKTMMARRLPSILPEMSYEEKIEVTKIYSIAGELNRNKSLIVNRPFRSPHHTISAVALVGGGRVPKPGEVSLAHYGVLFLDELPEFQRNVIEILRQPLEDEMVTIARVNATLTYPSKFMLVASMNPCPCGYYGDESHQCTCTPNQISKYLSKISGPLLDRIDLHVEISPVKYEELSFEGKNTSSEELEKGVKKAFEIQKERYKNEKIIFNSQLNNRLLKKYCILGKEEKKLLEAAFSKLALSARAYTRIIKLSRTIADLEGAENIQMNHIAEAIQYRSLDKKFWNF